MRRTYRNNLGLHTDISRKVDNATIPKGMVRSFELLNCFSKKFERMAQATIDGMFVSAKEKQQK